MKTTDLHPREVTVEKLWRTFEAIVLAGDAGDVQRTEMKRAFYAGFIECFIAFNTVSAVLPEAEAIAKLAALNEEAHRFCAELIATEGGGGDV